MPAAVSVSRPNPPPDRASRLIATAKKIESTDGCESANLTGGSTLHPIEVYRERPYGRCGKRNSSHKHELMPLKPAPQKPAPQILLP